MLRDYKPCSVEAHGLGRAEQLIMDTCLIPGSWLGTNRPINTAA